jgi:hypothetical protein
MPLRGFWDLFWEQMQPGNQNRNANHPARLIGPQGKSSAVRDPGLGGDDISPPASGSMGCRFFNIKME